MRSIFVFFIVMLLSGFSPIYVRNQNLKHVVTPAQLKEWVSFLASDQMRGRSNGSPEMKIASEWIAEQFKENGLKPFDSIVDYIQNYTFISRQKSVNERNIIGFIEGTDPSLKNEYIVLSAHFDHIGIRRSSQPDSIYNGADDNAAGTCALIGIARTIKETGLKSGRSIIFAAFSGEEGGMRGSRYFVSHSPIPFKNIYADLNFEMIGHSEYLGKNNYYMTGCTFSNLDDLIGQFDKESGFKLVDTIQIARNLFYQSDNIAFSRIKTADNIIQGIPSGTFATTTMAGYIHNTTDEVQLFDFDNMAELVSHFSGLVIWLSENKTEIKWTDPKFVRPE
jgi:hypothetical protein